MALGLSSPESPGRSPAPDAPEAGDPVTVIERARRAPWWAHVLLVFAASRVVTTTILLAFAAAQPENPWTDAAPGYADFATIWDGHWYFIIAAVGYPVELPLDAAGHVGENAWAFLPLYPGIVRVLMLATGLPFDVLAVAVSVGFAAGAALVFHRLMTRVMPGSALFATALFCFAPLSPILQVGYAESLQLFLLFVALLLVLERRYLLLVPVAAALAFTRPGALALALLLGLHAIHRFASRRTDAFPLRERVALVVAGLSTAALGFAWLGVAGLVTGSPTAYLDTELAWRAVYVGREEFVPFTPWFQGARWWLWWNGVPDPLAWWIGGVLLVVTVAAAAILLVSPVGRRLGVDLRLWLVSYALYLLAVFFPQSSVFRLLMPLAPGLGMLALPRSRAYRAGVLALFVALQVGWTAIGWRVDGADWTPP